MYQGTKRTAAFLILLLLSSLANAATTTTTSGSDPAGLTCPSADIWGQKLISGVCWSCMLPIRLFGSINLGGSGNDLPDGVNTQAICQCQNSVGTPQFGTTLGMWSPSRLIEVVRKPYCSPGLGGITLRNSWNPWGKRGAGKVDGKNAGAFYNYHYYAFPLHVILELMGTLDCNSEGYSDFDLMYMSEVDPTWNEDELAFFTNPEAAIFSNPLMLAACSADCIATIAGNPLEQFYWCAGCWGGLYPFTGHVNADASPVRVTSLLATKAIAALHRRGLARKTVGGAALCGGYIYPTIPKSTYKMSMLFPIAEASNTATLPTTAAGGAPPASSPSTSVFSKVDEYTQGCCHKVGASQFMWGEWRNIPGVGEDYVYMLWKYTDCCVR
jgi:conjugal transfer pilus assembly protein TraU